MIYGLMTELFQDSNLRKIKIFMKIIRYLDKFIFKKALFSKKGGKTCCLPEVS